MTGLAGTASAAAARPVVELGDLAPARHEPPPEAALAGILARSLAALIDLAVLVLLLFVESFVLLAVFGLEVGRDLGAGDAPYFLVAAVIAWLYCAGFDSGRRGATPGKRAVGLEVVDLGGERPGFARASLRCLARVLTLATAMLGWAAIAFTRRKQALHDLAAGTLVIRTAARPR
ncbi:MAG: RDD family protein [Rhodospirillales bacterium]